MSDDLRVMITLMDGEHRIHLNGRGDKVAALCEIGAPDIKLQTVTTPRVVASGPDTAARQLLHKWRGASGSPSFGQAKMRAAAEVLGLFQSAWSRHF